MTAKRKYGRSVPSRANTEVRPGIRRKSALEPRAGRANAAKNITIVSGQLRTSVTYVRADPRSGGTGEMRRIATIVPRISAPDRGEDAHLEGDPEAAAEDVEVLDEHACSTPGPPSGRAIVPSSGSTVGVFGSFSSNLPAVSFQALAYRPSSKIFSSTSLRKSRNSLSPFFRPMPYGSSVNGVPTSLNSSGSGRRSRSGSRCRW